MFSRRGLSASAAARRLSRRGGLSRRSLSTNGLPRGALAASRASARRRRRLGHRLLGGGLLGRMRRRHRLVVVRLPALALGLLRKRLLLHRVQHLFALPFAASQLVVRGIDVDIPRHLISPGGLAPPRSPYALTCGDP